MCFNLPAEETATSRRILYLAHQGKTADAIDLYRTYTKARQQADYELLQQLGLGLLESGFASNDAEAQLMAVFGAGIAAHDQAACLLSSGLDSPHPEVQLVSLDLLAKLGNDDADSLINRAASSEQPLIRLTALYYLAQKKHPLAMGQIEALYYKVPPELRVIFPQFFALSGDPRAILQLRRMLHDSEEDVRLEAIVCIGEQGRDDLLPQIRTRLAHPHPKEQEACAAVVGKLADQRSIPRLRKISQSKVLEVRLAAKQALYRLGQQDVRPEVEALAKEGNLFAIALLGEMEGSEECLYGLMRHPNIQIRCNATLALVKRRDPRCIEGLADILIKDARDLGFAEGHSRGKSLSQWRVMASATQVLAETPLALELSTALRERTLAACIDLPQQTFLNLADAILERQQNDLVPITVELLEQMGNTAAIDLLKKHQQKIGAPLVRNYCTLALYKIGEPGPYGEKLRQWLVDQRQVEMMSFRPFVPLELREEGEPYALTPKETSRLFIASIEALGNQHDAQGLDVLLDLIRDGNPKNRFALAGLLMRTTQ
jgi:HEAT repeat protein